LDEILQVTGNSDVSLKLQQLSPFCKQVEYPIRSTAVTIFPYSKLNQLCSQNVMYYHVLGRVLH